MLIDKLADGVVRVQTPIGPRYVMPTFLQRIFLLWLFRHFTVVPYAVLRGWQQRLIDNLCSEQKFISMVYSDHMNEAPVIGTIEHRPIMGPETLPPRRPAGSETTSGLAAQRQRP